MKPLTATYRKYTLNFIRPAGTSRGTYHTKDSWFLKLDDGENFGVGECSVLQGLSLDDRPDFENRLTRLCASINAGNYDFNDRLADFPSIQFGLETAFRDLLNGGKRLVFDSSFSRGESGLVTNGLIWMGDTKFMLDQIAEKFKKGFSCIKLKIGSLNWKSELDIIRSMRHSFPASELSIRVDANGAFSEQEVRWVLDDLAALEVHSIEQPIKAGQWETMARLCAASPVPVALDEELIGVSDFAGKQRLLETIRPQYLILKPALLGGFSASDEWISLAESSGIGWWATSALESNIGLNAIAQWVSTKETTLPQGLGTGLLYSNNIGSPLTLVGEQLWYDTRKNWESEFFQ